MRQNVNNDVGKDRPITMSSLKLFKYYIPKLFNRTIKMVSNVSTIADPIGVIHAVIIYYIYLYKSWPFLIYRLKMTQVWLYGLQTYSAATQLGLLEESWQIQNINWEQTALQLILQPSKGKWISLIFYLNFHTILHYTVYTRQILMLVANYQFYSSFCDCRIKIIKNRLTFKIKTNQ